MPKLTGKVALITGGSCGIGLAIARKFLEEGAYVFITGRRQSELDKAKSLLGDENVTTVQGDISSMEDLDRLFETIDREKGTLHIVVANAGFAEPKPTESVTPEHFDKIFNINTRGTYFTVQKALPLMKSGGSIVLISSGAHLKAFSGFSVYSGAKAALRSFARVWALELKEKGIRVNTITPGSVDTIKDGQFPQEQVDAIRAKYSQLTPLGRMGRPDELASSALFLASEDSSFITGIDLVVDGGLTQL